MRPALPLPDPSSASTCEGRRTGPRSPECSASWREYAVMAIRKGPEVLEALRQIADFDVLFTEVIGLMRPGCCAPVCRFFHLRLNRKCDGRSRSSRCGCAVAEQALSGAGARQDSATGAGECGFFRGGVSGRHGQSAVLLISRMGVRILGPFFWRRGRDSNPRYAINVYTLSRRAPSTTRPPLREAAQVSAEAVFTQ